MGFGRTLGAAAVSGMIGAGSAWLVLAGRPDASLVGGPVACADPRAAAMQRVELVFGLARKGRAEVSEAEWGDFLRQEVTPRFPDGLTGLRGDGQWRTAGGEILREPARLLLVWAQLAGDLGPRVEAIRAAWKQRHGQESVLRADSRQCVSF